MAAEYTYRVSAWWTSGRTGLAKCDSAPNAIHFSDAPELGGLEGRWTPEQLLLCALAGCFTTTFEDVARVARFEYMDLEVEVEGRVHRNKAACNFSEIILRPRLIVHSEEEFEAGMDLLRRTKSVCMISRAITVPQTLEPRVEAGRMPPGGWQEDSALKLSV
jgi:organic hydroperoxide reductase OsmC/OhrA